MYTLTTLNSIPGCDDVLQRAQHERSELQMKVNWYTHALNQSTSNINHAQTQIDAFNAEIASLTAEINTMPDGPEKDDKIAYRGHLEYRRHIASKKVNADVGVLNADRQYELAIAQIRITETDVFIAAVEARKAELQSG